MAWNRPTSSTVDATSSSRSAGRGRIPRLCKGLIAGLVIVALGAAYIFLFSGGDAEPGPKVEKPVAQKPKAVREVKPAPKPAVEKQVEVAEKPAEKYPGERIVEVLTNGSYIIEVTVNAEGRRTKHVIEPPSPWKYSTDSVLATALQCAKGGSMPPWPSMGIGMDKEFRKSLNDPIVVLETDDERTAALKQIVSSARAEIKERLDAGEHFCDVINDFRELTNENGKIRADAILELKKIRDSGDEESARKYEVIMNAAFSQMGIDPIGGGEGVDDGRPRRYRKAVQSQPTKENNNENN